MKYTRSAAIGAASALIVGFGLVALPAAADTVSVCVDTYDNNAIVDDSNCDSSFGPGPHQYQWMRRTSYDVVSDGSTIIDGDRDGSITIHKLTNPTGIEHDGSDLGIDGTLDGAEFTVCRVDDAYITSTVTPTPSATLHITDNAWWEAVADWSAIRSSPALLPESRT
ncbi:MAG: hypothetical protein FWG25_06005 [Promicromonosporaceae bacterium]|nr:hypothetical protein [Promicromonosporaceae bacterium]